MTRAYNPSPVTIQRAAAVARALHLPDNWTVYRRKSGAPGISWRDPIHGLTFMALAEAEALVDRRARPAQYQPL